MAKVHFILQGKGGVGKSMIASTLAQHMEKTTEKRPLCIDTDPVNSTFQGYTQLDVTRLEIMKDDEINTREFDQIIEMIAGYEGTDVIIDNGASSFIPLSNYLISNHVPTVLEELGHECVIHTVITGGQALMDTVSGFAQLASQLPKNCLFVAWLNPYFGPIDYQGKSFQQMKAYVQNKDRVSAIIELPSFKEETYGHDFSNMLKARITFAEALEDPSLNIMERQRIKTIQKLVGEAISAAAVL